ncbi:MAG: SGNH/GDSL hydrolase family protein, partial [Planctomycetota bacterium]
MTLELAVRIYRGALFSFEPLGILTEHDQRRQSFFEYDEVLGHRPTPGDYRHEDGWEVRINSDHLRSHGRPISKRGDPILAVGDSFTFGDEVDDGETWPAYLDEELRRSVLNAGVSSYGLDQAVIRAERLLPKTEAGLVILAIVSGDVNRCELSYRNGTWKPYFTLDGQELVLHNQPVPQEER